MNTLTTHQKRVAGQPLRDRTPEQWVKQINTLPAAYQSTIAKIVWWDYFGVKTSKEAWHQLDKLRDAPLVEIPESYQIKALIILGYQPHVASKRVGFKEQAIENMKFPKR